MRDHEKVNILLVDDQPAKLLGYETILGGYFRLWLTKEGLLTGKDSADAAFMYFRANGTPLIIDTAQAFATGLLPAAAPVNVNSYTPPASDPLFDPVDAGVAAAGRELLPPPDPLSGNGASSSRSRRSSEDTWFATSSVV